MAAPIPVTLGRPVSSRSYSWLGFVEQAWGSSFRQPDHRIYVFSNGRGFDSTDLYASGIYQQGVSQSWTIDYPTTIDAPWTVDQMNTPEIQ
jgi:hypothetical protein